MGIWGVVQIIGVAWFAVSVVSGLFIAIVGKRIWRKPPVPRIVRKDAEPISQREVDAVFAVMTLDADLRGLGGER